MRYGFVIDQRKCIGCHACTVACKEENQVPLGVNRTWVKYIEKGTFPDTRRYFSVLRCNHCDNAPCVTICPTVALYRRADGIVDFDGDALHRLQVVHAGLPLRRALHRSRHPDRREVPLLRAPRGGGARARLRRSSVPCRPSSPATSTTPTRPSRGWSPASRSRCASRSRGPSPSSSISAPRCPRSRRRCSGGTASTCFAQARTIPVPGRPNRATAPAAPAAGERAASISCRMARTVYDVAHAERPWGWKVSTYLWTKSIAAGALLVAGARHAGRARRRQCARRPRRAAPRPRLPGPHHRAARGGSQAARALPLHPREAQLALVAGLGRLDPDGVRRGRDAWLARRPGRPPGASSGWPRCPSSSWPAPPRATARFSSGRPRAATSGRARCRCRISSWRRWPPAAPALLLVAHALAGGGLGAPWGFAWCCFGSLAGLAVDASRRAGGLASHPRRRARRAASSPAARSPARFWGGVVAAGIALPIALLATTSPAAWTAGALLALSASGSTRTSGSARASPSR